MVPEPVPVCRQCHKNCLSSHKNTKNDVNPNKNEDDDVWRPLLLMGLSAINPAASLLQMDPFSSLPEINIAPPTPEISNEQQHNCNCRPEINTNFNHSIDLSDDSPQTEEPPYHSLNSSNMTLRRYGTVSSLERLGQVETQEENLEEESSSESEDGGIDNEAFYQSSIRNWTARAGSFMAEKMTFFEKLGEDYRSTGKFFER